MRDRVDEMDQILMPSAIKTSQKYSVPIIYINSHSHSNEWSNKIREYGGIIFKFWDLVLH